MTMASVAVTQGSQGNSPAMLTQKRYHLQTGTNPSSPSPTPSPTPGKNYDTLSKGKKSWSVRLGLSRQSQISEDGGKQGWGTISGGSALSRQMRYGDPWLYGTVREHRQNLQDPRNSVQGYIGPPAHGAPILVVCSCPEFLSGTTRRLGNCKKCGGHRLAGLPLGGTCRAPSTSSRTRPSLAGVLKAPLDDPYDVMRRSRLVEPRSRARSISPHRQGTPRDTRSQSVAINNLQRSEWFNADNNFRNNNDGWPDDAGRNPDESRNAARRIDRNNPKRQRNVQRDADARKSILECDVNPYLLVKKQLRDEDDFSDDLSDNALELDEPLPTLFDPSKVKSIERIPARCSVAAIGGQRIRVFNEPREISEEEEEEEGAEEQEEDGGREVREDFENDEKRRIARERDRARAGEEDEEVDEDYHEKDVKLLALPPPTNIPIPKVSPKRPPRKQKIEAKTTTNTVPVKSILKKPRGAANCKTGGKKKSVLFKVDNVIFAPVKTDFGTACRRQSVKSSGVSCQDNTDERREEQILPPEEKPAHDNRKPKFITIPNIKVPKPTEKIYSSKIQPLQAQKGDKLVQSSSLKSGIPKSIDRPDIMNYDKVVEEMKAQDSTVETKQHIAKETATDPGLKTGIRPEDETELEIEIEELEEPPGTTPLQDQTGTDDHVKRPALQRSQSERIVPNTELVDDVPFTDTMRLSVRKRHRVMKNAAPASPYDCSTLVPKSELVNGVPQPRAEEKTEMNSGENLQENVPAFREKEPEPTSPGSETVNSELMNRENLENFQRMRPTSWSPPPVTKHKNLPQNRSSDPGTIDFKLPMSSPVAASSYKASYERVENSSKVGISSGQPENVFKITVSPLQSPLVHRLRIGSSDTPSRPGGRRTSIMINGDQNLSSETSSDNKVTISVGGEDSVCNPTVISVNSDTSPKIKSSSENRTLVILDNYSSNIIVAPSKESRLSRTYSEGSDDSLERSAGSVTPTDKRGENFKPFVVEDQTALSHQPEIQLRKVQDERPPALSKEAVVSKLLEDSLKKARRNGEILDESSGEAILKILKQTLLKSSDYESSESTIELEQNYSRSSSLNSEVDFVSGNMYIEENPYEVIKEPIYEEIPDEPPPLPLSPPPTENYQKDQIYFGEECKEAYYKKFNTGKFLRSYFPDDFFKKPTPDELQDTKISSEGLFNKKLSSEENYASKFELYNYLIDSKERTDLIEEEEDAEGELEALYEQKETSLDDLSSKSSQISNVSDSSEESNIALVTSSSPETLKMRTVDIERTDSGVGSESSQASSSRGAVRRWRGSNGGSSPGPGSILGGMPQVVSGDSKLCQDCEQRLDPLVTISGVVYAPFVCRKCAKKRSERKEIIMEIVETEQKYGRDLQIILEEFYRPMLRAGLLTQDQLSAIFLNVEELLDHNVNLAEKLRDAVDFAQEAGDEDLVTMDVGKIFLESEGMLHAFESYCTRQGGASLLLQNLEKEKELLRIFLKVSQMENTVLRRMNLNSFLMVPVQRVTKYPLLLARLFKATPSVRQDIQIAKNKLKQAQTNIELHLEHMNAEAKDVTSTKLWRRISIIQNARRSMGEQDMVNIKLRKMAVEVLEWAHEEVRFALEGRLLVALPTDNNWRRGKTVKLVPVTAMLVTNGKPNTQFLDITDDSLFPRQIGIKEATLLLVKEKIGRYSLLREPLYLDKCIVCCEADLEDYFEIQELSSKETFIFKAEDGVRTKRWCRTLQAHAQSLGAWRKRRGALANIMICGVARN